MSSYRGKRKDEDCAEAHAPPKKFSKAQSSDDSDDVVICELSQNKRLTVRKWQGKLWIDIREFFIKDGKQFPGKKGITLNLEQWGVIRNNAGEIDKALAEFS